MIWPLKVVGEMERWPRGYGVAWKDPVFSRYIAAPVGLHLVLGAVRAAWIGVRTWCIPSDLERMWDLGYEHGFRDASRSYERLEETYAERLEQEITRAEARGRQDIIDELFTEVRGPRITH